MMLLRLFYEFFKIGLFSVGGGMATLPFMYDLSDKTAWFTHGQLADMLAVSESTPGPIGVNMATYVGYATAGVPGALCATLGMILPGVALVLLVTGVLERFRGSRTIEGAFYGLRPASAALITAAGVLVAKLSLFNAELYGVTGALKDLFNWKALALAAVLLVLTRWFKPTKKLHPVVFIAASAAAGVLFSFAGV